MQVRSEFQADLDEEVRISRNAASLANLGRIAQEVADELHTLRAAQNADSSSRSGGTPNSHMIVGGQSPVPLRDSSRVSFSSTSQFSQQNPGSSQLRWLELAEDEVVLDQMVHGVPVSSNRILKLFHQYVHYSYRMH